MCICPEMSNCTSWEISCALVTNLNLEPIWIMLVSWKSPWRRCINTQLRSLWISTTAIWVEYLAVDDITRGADLEEILIAWDNWNVYKVDWTVFNRLICERWGNRSYISWTIQLRVRILRQNEGIDFHHSKHSIKEIFTVEADRISVTNLNIWYHCYCEKIAGTYLNICEWSSLCTIWYSSKMTCLK